MATPILKSYHLDVTISPSNDGMRGDVNVYVGTLRVAEICSVVDVGWQITTVFKETFPFGSDIKPTKDEAIAAVLSRLGIAASGQ